MGFCYAYGADSIRIEPDALEAVGLRSLTVQDPNLTGFDIKIATICRSMTYDSLTPMGDYRFNMNHQAFIGANVFFEDHSDGTSGISSHATAIGGLLLGLDNNAYHPQVGPFAYVGACPDATVTSFEFWRFASLYLYDGRPFDAQIVTLSLGEIFPNAWTQGIERLVQDKGIVVFAAAGNGQRVYDPVLYPAAGANVIAVGVVNSVTDPNSREKYGNFSTTDPFFSSSGPTADNRCKPDIVAPGKGLVPSSESSTAYTIEGDWSSMATPIAAGATALLLQKAQTDPNLADPVFTSNTNNVVKAILLTSATKLPYWHKGLTSPEDDLYTPLDYSQGAGQLHIQSACNLLSAGRQSPGIVKTSGWDNAIIDPEKEPLVYEFRTSGNANEMITATLCWNRAYEKTYPFEPNYAMDSDLAMELRAIDPDNSQNNIILDISDSVNDNVEHIYLATDPNYTVYQLVVRFSGQHSARQTYAVAWTVASDSSANNPFWYDLNNDGTITAVDRFIFLILDQQRIESILAIFKKEKFLGLTQNRLEVLREGWPVWKNYLANWKKY